MIIRMPYACIGGNSNILIQFVFYTYSVLCNPASKTDIYHTYLPVGIKICAIYKAFVLRVAERTHQKSKCQPNDRGCVSAGVYAIPLH